MNETEYNAKYQKFSAEFGEAYRAAYAKLKWHKKEFGADYVGVEIAEEICQESIHQAQLRYDAQMATIN